MERSRPHSSSDVNDHDQAEAPPEGADSIKLSTYPPSPDSPADSKGKRRSSDEDNDLHDGNIPVSPHRSSKEYGGVGDEDDDDEEEARLLESTDGKRPLGRRRASTIGSLSFSTHILPLLPSQEDGPASATAEKQLSWVSGCALSIGGIIGSGIFSSPGVIASDTESVGAALVVWMAAMILAWTGASSFAELGAMIRENGGAQRYLDYALGPFAGFEFAWTAIVALKPGSAAIISIVTGEYICRVAYHTAYTASPSESAKTIPLVVIKIVAVLVLASVSLLNALSARVGTRAHLVLTSMKLVALFSVLVMGMVQLGLGKQSDAFQGNIFEGSSSNVGGYALAMYSGLWSVDGWDATNYVAGELRNAKRDVPRVIHLSMASVFVLYMAANCAYFVVLPLNEVAHSNTIALDFGRALFGPAGGIVFAMIVAVSCFGALHSSVFTTARIIASASREGYIMEVFAKKHSTRNTPINALLLNMVLTTAMIAVGDFKSLVSFFGVCSWSFYLLTIISLLVLRVREPNLERPYRTFLSTPIIFACVASFLLLMPIFSAPLQALAGFGFIAAGAPVYYLTQRRGTPSFNFTLPSNPFKSRQQPPTSETTRSTSFGGNVVPADWTGFDSSQSIGGYVGGRAGSHAYTAKMIL